MSIWTRRTFLAAPAALALEGGTPVRKEPLRARLYGPLYYDDAEWTLVAEVLKTRSPFRYWGSGPEPPQKVATFEREFAAFMGTKYALAVNSGTTALQAAIAALGVGPGDEVIVPAWTWHSCFNAVVLAGGLPICAEIDESFNLDPALVERHITPATKVLMIVHLQGNPAAVEPLMAIARKHKLKVLEDVSQSVGARYQGKPLGSMGDIAIASLQVNKTISAGEGGAVYTNDPILFERAVRFHDVGGIRDPHKAWLGSTQVAPFIGTNYRMNELTGAVLLAQIRKLPQIVSDIQSVSGRVYAGTRDLPGVEFRKLPDPKGELGSAVFFGFKNQQQRDRFLAAMKAENVPCSPPSGSVILPVQSHIMAKQMAAPGWPTWSSPRGQAIQYGPDSCPQTIAILNRFAGVPLDPKFTAQDTADIVAAVRKTLPQIG
jgi:8-amino-3,8-dideoxy-alpha-D-manno-octulosonate transaminase